MLPSSPPLTRPEVILRSFAGYAILIRVLFGLLLRLRILLIAPLKPDAPLLWLAMGMAEGAAVSAVICIAVIALSGKRWTEVGRSALVIAFTIIGALYLVFAEAIAYFGHGLHAENFDIGLHPRLFSGSAQGGAADRIVILLALYVLALLWADARARKATSTWVTLPRLSALVVPGVLAVASAPYVHLAETTVSPVVQLLQLVHEQRRFQQLHGTIEVPRPTFPATAIRALVPPRHRQFIDDRYPLEYMPPPRSDAAIRLPANVRPNVVLILMESMRSAEIGAYGGGIPGLTPNFDALARDGILIDDAYSVGGYTPEGELGVWYGLLASPYEIVIRNRPDVALLGLPEMLRARDYDLLWAHPGDQTFYLSSRFYARRGFRSYDGTSFPPSEPRTNWGYSDKALARHTLHIIDHISEPFAAMELTVSNHHPFELPSDAEPFRLRLPLSESEYAELQHDKIIGQRTIPMFRTVHYSDEALGYFFHAARTHPWFQRTIFIIVGDHGTPTRPLHEIRSEHELMMLRHRVALLFYSPLLKGGVRIPGPASQADILPTIAGLLGIGGPRAGTGVDLFDPSDRAQDRPVISWNPEARTVTVTTATLAYHGVVANLGTNPVEFNSEILVDTKRDPGGMENLAEIRPAQTEQLRQIARIYLEVYPYLIATGQTGALQEADATKPRAQRLSASKLIPNARNGNRRNDRR